MQAALEGSVMKWWHSSPHTQPGAARALPRESAGSIFSSTAPAAVHSASLSFPPPLQSESVLLPAVRGQEDSGPGGRGLLRVLALPCHFKSRSGLPFDTHSAWQTPLVPSWPRFADRHVSADGVSTQWQSQEPGCPGWSPLRHFGGVQPCVLCLSVSSEMVPRGACHVWLWWLDESVHMKPLGVWRAVRLCQLLRVTVVAFPLQPHPCSWWRWGL